MPFVAVRETPVCGMAGVLKRGSDLVLATTALLLVAPLLVAIAERVKRSSPGPILFRQRRYGLDGHEITVYKFRTMTVSEDGADPAGDARRPARHAHRAFLRRTSFDELPQLLNVLGGSMSLVGPAARRRAQRAVPQARQRLHAAPQGAARNHGAGPGQRTRGETREHREDEPARRSTSSTSRLVARPRRPHPAEDCASRLERQERLLTALPAIVLA